MKLSIKVKTIIMIGVTFILLSVTILISYYQGIDNIINEQYGEQANATARSIALSVDGDMAHTLRDAVLDIYKDIPEDERMSREQAGSPGYEEYLDKYAEIKKMSEFMIMKRNITKTMEQTQVYDLRLCCTDAKTGTVIYLTDATTDPDFAAAPGSFRYIEEENQKVLDAPGVGFEPQMTNTDEFGWLMTTAAPLYDMNFHVVGFAEISIDMNSVVREMHRSARNMAIIVLLIIMVIGALITIYVERTLVRPINMLSEASVRYYNKDSEESARHIRFADLNIHTGDEIETLANSMALMEKDIEDYITNLTETRVELNTTREYAEEMDRIAYFDALTGVRNKRAYEFAIRDLCALMDTEEQEFGIAVVDLNDLKYYNDTFGHEKGDEAIRMICRIICTTFDRSPVFRYGGDEFTIILKGHDLANVDSLIDEMGRKMAELSANEKSEPWTRVSAAIGYAVYDPAIDVDPDTVFKRADNAMYENKKEIKKNKGSRGRR